MIIIGSIRVYKDDKVYKVYTVITVGLGFFWRVGGLGSVRLAAIAPRGLNHLPHEGLYPEALQGVHVVFKFKGLCKGFVGSLPGLRFKFRV